MRDFLHVSVGYVSVGDVSSGDVSVGDVSVVGCLAWYLFNCELTQVITP
jgi:hypothetical protein